MFTPKSANRVTKKPTITHRSNGLPFQSLVRRMCSQAAYSTSRLERNPRPLSFHASATHNAPRIVANVKKVKPHVMALYIKSTGNDRAGKCALMNSCGLVTIQYGARSSLTMSLPGIFIVTQPLSVNLSTIIIAASENAPE